MHFALVIALLAFSCELAAAQAAPQAAAPSIAPSPEAYFEFMLARRFESQGDSDKALEALKRAQALDPKSAEILAEMAGLFARQNKGAEAVDAAERALALDPDNTEAHRMLGLVFAAWSDGGVAPPAGRTPAEVRASAIEHLTKIVETPLVATDLNLQLTLARLQLRSGRADRAVPLLENIVSQAPFATEPYALLAEARLAIGRVDAAIEALTSAAELNPRHYVTLAELYERRGRFADAAAAYEKALANPRGATRDLRLRWFSALLNIPGAEGAAKARDQLKDFLMTSPQDARGLFLLSTASLQLGDLTQAEEVARKLIALDPAGTSGLHALAATLLARRDYRKVVEALTPFANDVAGRGKGRENDNALLLAQLAHAHTQLGEHDRAVAILTAAVIRDPLNAPALNSLGYTLAERGQRLPEAIGFIERALKVDPDNPAYLDSLGWALFKHGRADEAEPHLSKAAGALPTQSVIQDHYGDVLARRGKFLEAISAWERALAGDGADIDRPVIEKKIKDAKDRRQ
jgi:tetratricopeptide (TPR) repeat protein